MTQPLLILPLTKSWSDKARESSVNARSHHAAGDAPGAAQTLGYTGTRKDIVSPSLAVRHFDRKKKQMESDGWEETAAAPSRDVEENGVKGRVDIYHKNGVLASIRTYQDPRAKGGPNITIPKSGISFHKARWAYTPEEQAQMKKQEDAAAEVEKARRARIDKLYEEKFGKKPAPRIDVI